MPRTLALTGSTGFIGAALLRKLIRAGWNVRALHRQPFLRPRPEMGCGAIQWIHGCLEDSESLHHLVQGTEAVVHCAGAIRGATAAEFRRVNVEGVMRLVQACRKVRPFPRWVLISSLAAREPHLSDYAGSKREGEDALQSAASDMMRTVLRPPAVYGPGDRETLPLVRSMQFGVSPVLGRRNSRFSMLFVEDLADAVGRLLEAAAPRAGATFEIHDGRNGGYTWADLIQTVARVIRKPIRPFRIPDAVLYAVARGNLLMARVFGYAPMLTPGKVRELTHPDWVCNDTELRRATGWSPRFLLEAGMRQTLQQLRHGRWAAE
ncbi:MAG: NAD-dependent epimerase/dehydratase family protein [Desulfobacterales bacterium]|jgi:nucleoside-diphosphate-sugar epimerase|nr:NAD-dependent epimerase/dehydratase family protein [Desulfobacterales bacterium]